MAMNGEDDTTVAGSMMTMAHSERDLAHGVTNWMLSNFRAQLADAVKSTPLSVPLLCAIACREAGGYWLPLTPTRSAAEILGLCVYDASGDVAGAPRTAFPANTAEFRLSYGDDFTTMLIGEANKARAARGLAPAAMVYKGYGIFQYDLQYVRPDEAFFRGRKWYDFRECVTRAVAELQKKFDATGDVHEAVRAYNGSGPKAVQYARDVMRLLPFCEEAAGAAAATISPAMAARAASADLSGDGDPAAPAEGEISETADFETARVLANLGAPSAASLAPAPPLAAFTTLAFDLSKAQAFLKACMTSTPRVTYGLGAKVPFHGAVPGKDFTQVDCSGFVREAIRLSTNPPIFPDGSVVQHDWIREHGFQKVTIDDGKLNDDVVRIAFLRPQDSPHGIGHVVLISRAMTLESHGGVGPDTRQWDGGDWQSKAFVYVLARGAQLAMATVRGQAAAALALAASFTVRHGRRYRATVVLNGFEQFAGNNLIADKLTQVGFINVEVTGSGGTRQVDGTWDGPDTTAQLDPHLTGVVELPPGAAVVSAAAVASPAVIGKAQPAGNISTNVFTTQSLPAHHDGLLVVKLRSEVMTSGPVLPTMAMAMAPPATQGLSALAFYERAGMIKRVVRLRNEARGDYPAAAMPMTAFAAMTHTPRPQNAADPGAGVSFVELERGQDAQQLQNALASDPNVLSVSKVAARYLLARAPSRKAATAAAEKTAAAAPPPDSSLWNLRKILWAEARARGGFQDAKPIKVAVLDTGVDDGHPDLKVGAYHWQNPDVSAPVSSRDIVGHGTHVSGTIAALIGNQVGINGVCACDLRVWKIFADDTLYLPQIGAFMYTVHPILYRRALIGCIEDEVNVVNLSIGGPAVPDPQEQSLFDQLLAGGTTICAAMGNDRQSGSPTSYPAAIPGVIAVGATDIDDRVAVFSNSGNHIAVTAPGSAIWSTLPLAAGQTGFWAEAGADGTPREGKPMRREIKYAAWDGTSMATPHVSGCVALLLAKSEAAGSKLTSTQVRQALMATADKVPDMGGQPFSTDYGAGRVNLFELLK